MRKKSKYWAAFFKRTLAMLLAVVSLLGDVSVASAAALSYEEGTEIAAVSEVTDAGIEEPTEDVPEEPTIQEPTTDEPTTDEPTTDEPTTDEPTTDEPTTDEPTTDEPTTDEPTTDEPTTDEPTTDEPTTDEPTTDEPTTDEPTTDEPTTDEPTTDEPTDIQTDSEEEPIEEPVEEVPDELEALGSGSTVIDFSGFQGRNLDIYNATYYSNTDGTVTASGGSFAVTGANENVKYGIVIGDHSTEDPHTAPSASDIVVSLNGLRMAGSMTIKPVGAETSPYAVKLTVSSTSSVGALTVEKNARLELILDTELTVGSISLAEGSSLTVTGSGALNVNGMIFGSGTAALHGGTIRAGGISVRNLDLNRTVIDSSREITATDSLSIQNSTVANAAVFGYAEGSVGKTLTLDAGSSFTNVDAVGCAADSSATVTIAGLETVNAANTSFYNDYKITYQDESTVITSQSGWPTAYRVSVSADDRNTAVLYGYHTGTGFTPGGSIPLPADYEKVGYALEGWKISGTEGTLKEIAPTGGDVSLLAVLEPGVVTVILDRGYTPDQFTNDKNAEGKLPEQIERKDSNLNETVTLINPERFGYRFRGWKITSGTNSRIILNENEPQADYTIALADCIMEEAEGEEKETVVTMVAQWEEDTFKLTLFLGTEVAEDDNLQISLDGGNSWKTFKMLTVSPEATPPEGTDAVSGATQNVDFTIDGRSIVFNDTWLIKYGESISDYLHRAFNTLPENELPLLKDFTQGGTAKSFAGWSSDMGPIDGTTRFLYGVNGMLTPGSKPLTDYQASLHSNNASIKAVWGVMSYALALPPTMPKGWSLSYTGADGKEYSIPAEAETNGPIIVQQDSTVTLTTSKASPENFSLWSFQNESNSSKILPIEQSSQAGDPYLHYAFTMPAENVAATYRKGQEIWIDIAKSPIEFEENVSFNGLKRNGFWYADLIDEMTPLFQSETKLLTGTDINGNGLTTKAYFYQWVFSDKFCVTSNSVETRNQLTLVNALSGGVYLENVNLAMREAYESGANGSLIDGVDCESSLRALQDHTAEKVEEGLKNVNLADYANIVIDNSTWQAYTTTLNFQGENNTVGAIMQGKLRVSVNDANPLTLKGGGKDHSAVKLGAAFGNFQYTVSDITVTEYTKPNDFKFLFYCAYQTGCEVKRAVIQAPHKNMHAGCTSNTNKSISFENSTAELYSICIFRTFKVSGSYLRVHENVRLGIIPIYLEKSAKVVIDGNMEMNYHHWSDSDASENIGMTDDNSDNWLIVKGAVCDISNRTWRSGTLICNALVLGRTGGIKGGTVITNQIINQAVGFWEYNPETHTYGYDPVGSGQTRPANSNNDNYPFLVYHHLTEEPNTYTFSGGKIYLLGYYRATNKVYDSTVKATEAVNPVAQFMNPLIDGKGDLVENPSVNTDAVKTAVETSSRGNNECVVLGNSSNYYSQRRAVDISGGEIYAAGNITFYNDTTVSGGTIYCKGSFGSKGDLTVTGGSITATAVGNAYNLKTTLEDGTLRWKRTDIRGGTVTAERIGAFESVSNPSVAPETLEPKGTVTIGENAAIVGTPKICHDVYINYIFDTKLFDNNGAPKNKDSLRFETNWAVGTPFANQTWTNTALTFTPPVVVVGGSGGWNWDSLTGEAVDTVSAVGIAQKDSTDLADSPKAYDRIQMKLYAVKDSYNLIFKAGANEITRVTCEGTEVQRTEAAGQTTASAKAGGIVELTFANQSMARDYSVLWYIDGSGIIHSVNPNVVGNTLSFTMPNSDVEVYAARDLTLDLDTASYTLLQDGFRTEANAEPERTDSTFRYLGNLVIHQGCITEDITFNIDNFTNEQMNSLDPKKQTTNKILVDEFFNNSTNGRTVTLHRIYQNGTPTSHGIDLEEGANATFMVDGAIRICRIFVPSGSDVTLKGKNNNRSTDAVYPIVNGSGLNPATDYASIGNFWGQAGNITLQDLTILGKQQGMSGSLCYSGKQSTNTVTYKNCVYKSSQVGTEYRGWYNRSYLACRAETVIFDGCDFNFKVSRDWPGSYCDYSKEVFIQNHSSITVTDNGANDNDPGRPFYFRIQNRLVIDNSELNLSLRVPDDGKTYRVFQGVGSLPSEIKLTNNATLVLEQHARLKKLVIEDNSTVKAGTNGDGYLLCEDIQVNDSATLEAGGIIVAGFYNGNGDWDTETQFQKGMAEGKNIFDGKDSPGLAVNGGTVTAKEYITGDVNGKITVTGGTVSAPKIGTTGKLYGYTRYVPKAGEKYIYTYERIPVGMDISISGGTVDVSDYLGGMKANVSISGGEVRLGENAVLGLTQAQQDTLYNHATENHQTPANFGSLTMTGGKVEGELSADGNGGGSISLPYGTVTVSKENTAVSVYDMTAYCGTMMISGVTGKTYSNPYTGSDRIDEHRMLGVYVAHRMLAQNLTVTKGSVVYANMAYANVPQGETGNITVTVDGEDRAYLYTTDAYGVIGEGTGTYEYNDGKEPQESGSGGKNVFGKKVVDVHYVLRPAEVLLETDVNRVVNPNQTELTHYTVGADIGPLKPASCSGYEFLGWYEYDPVTQTLTDSPVPTIDTSNSKDLYLGAKWQKVKVVFEIQVEVDESECTGSMELVSPGTDGRNVYRFTETKEINYGDPILAQNGILLSQYSTKTLGIQSVQYNGTTIGQVQPGQPVPNTHVTWEMADAFVSGNKEPLILKVPEKSLTDLNTLIRLDQNKTDGLPAETRFNLADPTTLAGGSETSLQVSAYGSITGKLGDIKAFTKNGSLIEPTAPGYSFGGWYTNQNCSDGSEVTANTTIQSLHSAGTTTLYAKWTPNTYRIQFSAAENASDNIEDKRWVTVDGTAPAVGVKTKNEINYCWIYDTTPSKADSFWLEGTDGSADPQYLKALPCAWREGYFFEGWQLIVGSDTYDVNSTDKLSTELMKNLQLENFVGNNSDQSEPALTLYAKFRKVKVSYDLNGGTWKDATPTANPAYGNALPGYRKESDISNELTVDTDYTKLGPATGADGTPYCVVSTTSGYFNGHFTDGDSGYVPGDYREGLSRKGYTFQGWRKEGDTADYYGCTPRFEDLSLKAEWTANTYDLTLHVKDESFTHYVSYFSSPAPDTVKITGVTVGEPIEGTWPDKAVWYAYNADSDTSEENKRRGLLGVTFAALDPGTSEPPNGIYNGYAKAVTRMLNSGTLFDRNDSFFLPEDTDYGKDIEGATAAKSGVPDYPTGSMIDMYGVYRERSLVFIETYVDADGAKQSKIMYSHPWNVYTSYPYDQYEDDPEGKHKWLIEHDYALQGWYALQDTIDPSRSYPKSGNGFTDTVERWKTEYEDNYDINVYTVYVGQKTIEQTLTAFADPTAEPDSKDYILPGSMQLGLLSYEITGLDDGLKLVPVTEMLEHQYDNEWGVINRHTANDTVAVELVLEKDNTSKTCDLTDNGQIDPNVRFGSGWKVTLKLYHSKVMTQTSSHTFTIIFGFEEKPGTVNLLQEQWLKDNVTVELKPSRYEVKYEAVLPEPEEKLTLNNKGFALGADNVYTRPVKTDYGAALLTEEKTLTIEGYERQEKWSYGDSVSLTELMLNDVAGKADELKDGTIKVSAEYTPIPHTLAKDDTVPAGTWDILYSDGAGDTGAPAELGESKQVKYHSVVTFKPINDQCAEYITLSYTDSTGVQKVRLDTCTATDDGYTFVMPAYDVTISYSDVMELYLDKGTIELSPEGFKQAGVYEGLVTWPGNYRIVQNARDDSSVATANVLNIFRDMSGREIELGNLNISGDNSVALASDCKVTLTQTGDIQAKNILVPKNASLTMEGAATSSKSVTLRPEKNYAAIGGENATDPAKAANGSITLNNVNLAMTLNAPSSASGVGPGKRDSTVDSGAVTITNSRITVTENSSASGQYTGAWIGGAGVESVRVSDTTVENNGTNHGAKAVDGDTVTLTRCVIGSEANAVKEPIHAASSLTIEACKIIQSNEFDLDARAMIGTDAGTTSITSSTVKIDYISGGKSNELFTGTLRLEDAESDVKINGTQILELGHGSVEITEKSAVQAGVPHSSDTQSLHYLLLEEIAPKSDPSVTAESLGEGKTITVQKKASPVTVGALTINDDARLILNGELTVNGAAAVAEGKTLSVEAKDNHSVVSYEMGLSGKGSYSQTGGELNANADAVVKGDMSLTNVTANCGIHKIGSDGGGVATASTVTISGGSVTAGTVGACGTQNQTFTFVKTENDPAIEGKLVQDHYRLSYEVGELTLNVDALPTVLRSETEYPSGTVAVHDEIPDDPQGTDTANFSCWYIWSPDGNDRYGLLKDSEEKPSGLRDRKLLAKDTESKQMSDPAEDGTRTLSVYAWLNASGTAAIAKGRRFEEIGTDTAAEIFDRGAWTAMLESNATFITGRDYQATFEPALPQGTDLTLALLSSNGQTAYYHHTLDEVKDSVKFSDFTKMGTTGGTPPQFTNSGTEESFLLSADFGELADGAVPTDGAIRFFVLPGDGTPIKLGGDVSYTVTSTVNGEITATADTVTVSTPPSGDERRSGKTVYLVGTLSGTDGAPLDAEAKLTTAVTTINGQWLDGDTVAFELGSYESLSAGKAYTFRFEALPGGTYTVTWRLCTGETPNMLGGTCSNEARSDISVAAPREPRLTVICEQVSRVLAAGTAHSLSFDYEMNADAVTVTVEKQSVLANFREISGTKQTLTASTGTVSTEIPAEAGTYRVRFSIAEGSRNDDVYYSFIVE